MIKLEEQSNEFIELEKEWYKEVDTISSKNKLNNFVNKVMTAYDHDYGTYTRALAVCTKAFIRFYGSAMTNMQASFLMWEIIRHTFHKNDAFGLQLITYESILYPQELDRFIVKFDEETHQKIIDTAKKFLEEHKDAPKETIEHWEKLATGWLPNCVALKEKKGKAVA